MVNQRISEMGHLLYESGGNMVAVTAKQQWRRLGTPAAQAKRSASLIAGLEDGEPLSFARILLYQVAGASTIAF